MRNKVITILISIAVVILIFWIGHENTLGEDGLITQASNVEIEYNKKEILTVLKSAVNEKYIEAYNLSKEDTSKKIEDFAKYFNIDQQTHRNIVIKNHKSIAKPIEDIDQIISKSSYNSHLCNSSINTST